MTNEFDPYPTQERLGAITLEAWKRDPGFYYTPAEQATIDAYVAAAAYHGWEVWFDDEAAQWLAKPLTSTNTEAALRAALEPFAALLDPGEDWGAITIVDVGVRIEDVRRAREALKA